MPRKQLPVQLKPCPSQIAQGRVPLGNPRSEAQSEGPRGQPELSDPVPCRGALGQPKC